MRLVGRIDPVVAKHCVLAKMAFKRVQKGK
jgi:hypothetical protein